MSGFRFVFIMLISLTYGDMESHRGPRRRDSCFGIPLEFKQYDCTQFQKDKPS